LGDSNAIPHRVFLDCDFAIINPLQVDPSEWAGLDCLPIVPKGLDAHEAMLPRLAVLREVSHQNRLALLTQAEAHQRTDAMPLLSALLVSVATPAQLVSHLARQMVLKTPFRASFLLRYYDPLVFRHLRWIFNARQMAAFLGPVETWHYAILDTPYWHRQCVPGCLAEMKPRLDKEQWGRLHRIGLINAVVKKATRASLLLCEDTALFLKIDGYLKMAIEEAGLTEAGDQQCYALQALKFGPEYLVEAKTVQRVARSKSECVSYVGLCMEEGA